jgi:predicted HTH transcriptional regulator
VALIKKKKKSLMYFVTTQKVLKMTGNGIDNDIVGTDRGIDGTDLGTEKILNVLRNGPKITQKRLAKETGLSVRTIARELKNLRNTDIIQRVGTDRAGYWEIVK